MRVLGIYGSPREGGNSELLLDAALEAAQAEGAEVERLYVRELGDLQGCTECGACDDTGECIIEDDMVGVYPRLERAEAIVLATPIFFYSLPAQAKALVDRAQALWNRRRLSKPRERWRDYDSGRGYLIAVGATRGKSLFVGLEFTARYFFDALDMSYQGGLRVREVEAKGAVRGRPELLEEARALGRAVAQGRGFSREY